MWHFAKISVDCLPAFNNTRLVSIWCINNGGQAKVFHHSSGSLSYINSLSTCAHWAVCVRLCKLAEKGSFANLEAICSYVSSLLRLWGAVLQAGLMESYGVSYTSFLLMHTSNWSIFPAMLWTPPLHRCTAKFTPRMVFFLREISKCN